MAAAHFCLNFSAQSVISGYSELCPPTGDSPCCPLSPPNKRGPSAPSDPVSLLIQHSLTCSFLKYFYFYISVCAYVCMYSHMYAGTCRVQKWVPDTLELELQAAMSTAMDTGNWTLDLCRSSKCS